MIVAKPIQRSLPRTACRTFAAAAGRSRRFFAPRVSPSLRHGQKQSTNRQQQRDEQERGLIEKGGLDSRSTTSPLTSRSPSTIAAKMSRRHPGEVRQDRRNKRRTLPSVHSRQQNGHRFPDKHQVARTSLSRAGPWTNTRPLGLRRNSVASLVIRRRGRVILDQFTPGITHQQSRQEYAPICTTRKREEYPGCTEPRTRYVRVRGQGQSLISRLMAFPQRVELRNSNIRPLGSPTPCPP